MIRWLALLVLLCSAASAQPWVPYTPTPTRPVTRTSTPTPRPTVAPATPTPVPPMTPTPTPAVTSTPIGSTRAFVLFNGVTGWRIGSDGVLLYELDSAPVLVEIRMPDRWHRFRLVEIP